MFKGEKFGDSWRDWRDWKNNDKLKNKMRIK